MNNSILAQISHLSDLSFRGLKERWRDLFDTEPPPYSRSYMVKRLAYRIQELAHGVDRDALDASFHEAAKGKYGKKRNRAKEINRPLVGTRLQREWDGALHQVTVLADGFDYRGQKYNSLSRIAKVITGTVWSGPRFFGLTTS